MNYIITRKEKRKSLKVWIYNRIKIIIFNCVFFSIHRNRTFIRYNLIFGRTYFSVPPSKSPEIKNTGKISKSARNFPVYYILYTIYIRKNTRYKHEATRNNRHSWTISAVRVFVIRTTVSFLEKHRLIQFQNGLLKWAGYK